MTIPTAFGPIPVPRGWASLDAVIHGQPLRFVTTHLETDFPPIQLAQAKELLQGAGGTLLPVVFAGDFNATADEPADPTFATYKVFIDASTGKFGDAWKQAHPNEPGFTCCQDQNLLNANSKLNHRIDLILFRGAAGYDDVVLAGDSQAGRTPSGLWPSDHAGLAGTLKRRGEREDQSVVAQNRSPVLPDGIFGRAFDGVSGAPFPIFGRSFDGAVGNVLPRARSSAGLPAAD